MMKSMIVKAIAKINGTSAVKIADWRLVGTEISREERYFVRSGTELARAVRESLFSLTVYVDSKEKGGKYRGEATVAIQPSHTETEVEEKIGQALFAASKSRNPWFDLPGPAEPKIGLPSSGFDDLGEGSRMEAVRKALYAPEARLAAAGTPDGLSGPSASRINSLELFVSRVEKNFMNSKGHEFKTSGWKGYSEFVVEASPPKAAQPAAESQGPVELFDDIEFSDPEPSRLGEATGSRLEQVRDRAAALPLPSLNGIPVILSGKEAEEVFAWFFGNSTTGAIFTKASPFALGMKVQETEKGSPAKDPIDLWAEPVIQGLAASASFDPDGFPLERTAVIVRGQLKTLTGAIRHADWLGVPRKGSFSLFSVSPGTMPLAEMRAKPCLEPVMFSDFRLDPVTGDFGAEIRLAYWFDGEKRIPVTGGSISGSVAEFRSTMRRSLERSLGARSLCPKAVLLQGISVTGIA